MLFSLIHSLTRSLTLILTLILTQCGSGSVGWGVSASSLSEHLSVSPLKDGNLLLDLRVHMSHVMKRRCATHSHTHSHSCTHTHCSNSNGREGSRSCVFQSDGASQDLAQLYTLLPAQVGMMYSIHTHSHTHSHTCTVVEYR